MSKHGDKADRTVQSPTSRVLLSRLPSSWTFGATGARSWAFCYDADHTLREQSLGTFDQTTQLGVVTFAYSVRFDALPYMHAHASARCGNAKCFHDHPGTWIMTPMCKIYTSSRLYRSRLPDVRRWDRETFAQLTGAVSVHTYLPA